MKLTPPDIRDKQFRRAVRGYSDEDVDIFLDEVADEFERLYQDNMDLRERLHVLDGRVEQYENLKETLQKTLVSAQQQADETTEHARKDADLIREDAERKFHDILGEAQAEKQKVLEGLTQLRQAEESFRFKFRSLLEAHLNLLAEEETSEERREFKDLVSEVESASETPVERVSQGHGAEPDGGVGAPEDVELPPFLAEDASQAGSPHEPDEASTTVPRAGEVGSDIEEAVERTVEEPHLLPADEYSGSPNGEQKDPSVRGFLFGRQDEDEEDDFFSSDKSRDFEW